MLSLISSIGVSIVINLLMAHMGNRMPSNVEIYQKLASNECILQRRWEHNRAKHFNFETDPRYDDPRQQAGHVVVIQPPHHRIPRAFNVMSQCRRYEILKEMIAHGLIPGKKWDQPEPPNRADCTLTPVYARMWNVQDHGLMKVNDVDFMWLKRGYGDIRPGETKLWEIYSYIRDAEPADSGWRKVPEELLQPGLNTFQVMVENVIIPAGFLGFAGRHGPRTVSAQYVRDHQNPGPHGQFVEQRDPQDLRYLSLNKDQVHVDIICPEGK